MRRKDDTEENVPYGMAMPTMPLRKILIIDDDAIFVSFLTRFLEKYGYEGVHSPRADLGMEIFKKGQFAAILLDITMPGGSGLDACREIRKQSLVPIIMISALRETSDRIVGLELGADDYLPKPFEPRELVARLDALLRRANTVRDPGAILALDSLEINPGRRTVSLDGEPVLLSTAEFQLLLLLAEKPGHVFTRDDLMNGLRGIDWDAYNRSVDILISRLRRKLKENPKQPRFLKTIRGAGYTLLPPPASRKAG